MSNCIVFEDGILKKNITPDYIWNGLFSKALKNGHIINYIGSCLPKNSIFVIPKSDGNVRRQYNDTEKNNYDNFDWTELQIYIDYASKNNKIFLLGVLSQITEEPDINYVYLPLDDDFFKNGVLHFFPQDNMLPYIDRKSELCWRGGCSGRGLYKSIRYRFVEKLYDYKNSNEIKLCNYWRENQNIDNKYFGNSLHFTEFLKYKIFFIVDGNVIASNHMWGFASGAVPFLLSRGTCWFSPLIIPYVHYIPVNFDLSNLIEQIEYINNNEEIAINIVKNSLEFVKIYFSSEFQKEYLKKNINKYFVI